MFYTCPPENSVVTTRVQNVGRVRQIYGVCWFFILHASSSRGRYDRFWRTSRKQKKITWDPIKIFCFILVLQKTLWRPLAAKTSEKTGKSMEFAYLLSYTPRALAVAGVFFDGQVENEKNYLGSN